MPPTLPIRLVRIRSVLKIRTVSGSNFSRSVLTNCRTILADSFWGTGGFGGGGFGSLTVSGALCLGCRGRGFG